MENTNLKELVIDGQPQGLGNRVVTYDGLVDFLEMLKDELPRMGYNNKHPYSNYVYSAGVGNSIETAKYGKVIGYSNTVYSQNPELFQNFLIVGSNNKISSDGKNIFIFGTDNAGHGSNLLLIGEENEANWDCTNAYGFGNNLTLTSDAVWLGQYNDLNDSTEKIVFGIGNGNSNKRKNLLTIDEDGGIKFPYAAFKTLVHFEAGIDLRNSITLGQYTTIMSADGELRNVLMPYNNNEGFWLIEDTISNSQKVFHINYRQPYDSNGYTTKKTHIAPQEIHFHAGEGVNSWAKLTCGEINTNAQKIACGEINAKSILCDAINTNEQKITCGEIKAKSISCASINTNEQKITCGEIECVKNKLPTLSHESEGSSLPIAASESSWYDFDISTWPQGPIWLSIQMWKGTKHHSTTGIMVYHSGNYLSIDSLSPNSLQYAHPSLYVNGNRYSFELKFNCHIYNKMSFTIKYIVPTGTAELTGSWTIRCIPMPILLAGGSNYIL